MKGYRVIDQTLCQSPYIVGKIIVGHEYFYPNAVDCLVSTGSKYIEVEAMGKISALTNKKGRRSRMNILITDRLSIRRELTRDEFLEICTGVSQLFDEKGQLLRSSSYIRGQLQGLTEEWYPNGKMKLRVNYEDNQMSGLYEFWSRKGQLVRRYHYNKGKLDGVFEGWSKKGYLNEKRVYIGCQLTQTWHYNDTGELFLMTYDVDGNSYQIKLSDLKYQVRKYMNAEWCVISLNQTCDELIKLASDNNINLSN